MSLMLHILLWGSIATSLLFISTSDQLGEALRRRWKWLTIIVLLALFWRLPFDGHYFFGLEYEDSYIYPVAARYLASHSTSGTFLTTICAVGNWNSCNIPETSSGHFIGYPFMIAVAAKIIGYDPLTASRISIASSLFAVVIVFLLGELIDPGGVSGLAGAVVFSFMPAFAVFGTGTYAEPVSNLLVLTCFLMGLALLTSSVLSCTKLLVTWAGLTLTALLAIAVKRENVLLVPVLLLVHFVSRANQERQIARTRRMQYFAVLVTILLCCMFALRQLDLLEVMNRERVEYSQFPFNAHIWMTMFPLFVKEYCSWSWYFGSAILVLLSVPLSLTSRKRGLFPIALFLAYLVLYTSHVRSYYQVRGEPVTELDTIRYSMNLAGLWATMAGLGLSAVIAGLSHIPRQRWTRVIVCIGLVAYGLSAWIVTDRLKEDMIANEEANRLQPAEKALESIHRSGNPDTFLITLEPLVVQMLARDPVNVIDFKDFSTDLLQELRSKNPDATFFYIEQNSYDSEADRERYRQPFNTLDRVNKHVLVRGDNYAIIELL